jgi:hypothetical protein
MKPLIATLSLFAAPLLTFAADKAPDAKPKPVQEARVARLGNVVVDEVFAGLAANRAILAELATNRTCRNTDFRVDPLSARRVEDRKLYAFAATWECDERADTSRFRQSAQVRYEFESNALSAPGDAVPTAESSDLRLGFFSAKVETVSTTFIP